MQSSHVTSGDHTAEGHNFNPQIRRELANEPKVVHTSRNPNQEPFVISDELRARHEQSEKTIPNLNLSHGEFVILDIIATQ